MFLQRTVSANYGVTWPSGLPDFTGIPAADNYVLYVDATTLHCLLKTGGNCLPTGTGTGYPTAGIAVSNGGNWVTSLTAPTGALVGTTDAQTLTTKTVVAPILQDAGPTAITQARQIYAAYDGTIRSMYGLAPGVANHSASHAASYANLQSQPGWVVCVIGGCNGGTPGGSGTPTAYSKELLPDNTTSSGRDANTYKMSVTGGASATNMLMSYKAGAMNRGAGGPGAWVATSQVCSTAAGNFPSAAWTHIRVGATVDLNAHTYTYKYICIAALACTTLTQSYTASLQTAPWSDQVVLQHQINTPAGGTTTAYFDNDNLTVSASVPAVPAGVKVTSAGTIVPIASIFHVDGTATIASITPPSGFSSSMGGCIAMIADAGWSTTTVGGNIANAISANAGTIYDTCYDGTKWYLQASIGGTVTSVAMTVPTGFSVPAPPITGSGTFAVTTSGLTTNTVQKAIAGGLGDSSITDNGATVGIGGNLNIKTNALAIEVANQSPTGTVNAGLVAFDTGANPVTAQVAPGTLNKSPSLLGVVITGAGTSGNAQIARDGRVNCTFDNSTTIGDTVTLSTGTLGNCHDWPGGGEPTDGTMILGTVLASGAAGIRMMLASVPRAGGGAAGGSMVYPGAGIPVAVAGTSWGTSLAPAGTDYALTTGTANAWTASLINGGVTCGDSTHALSYSATTHTFGCQAIAGGGGGGSGGVAHFFAIPTAPDSVYASIPVTNCTVTGAGAVTTLAAINNATVGSKFTLGTFTGACSPLGGLLFTVTSATGTQMVGTTTAADIVSTATTGTATTSTTFATTVSVPATSMDVGTILEIRAAGTYLTGSTASPTMSLQVTAGGTTGICPAPSSAPPVTSQLGSWDLVCYIQLNTISGATSTADAWGLFENGSLSGTSVNPRLYRNASTVTYKTDTSYPVSVTQTITPVALEQFTLSALDVKVVYAAAGGGGSMVYPAAGIAVSPGGSGPWSSSLTAPAVAIVGTTDAQTVSNKTITTSTIDGVSAATMAYLDATSSIQAQINGKGPGSVTSVGITVPTGFAAGPAVTTSGSVAVTTTGLTTGTIQKAVAGGIGNTLVTEISGPTLFVGEDISVGSTNALVTEMANESGTGTTVGRIAKATGAPSTAILATTSDSKSQALLGIVISESTGTTSGVTSGTARIARDGEAMCNFDTGGTTAGDYVVASTVSLFGGYCADYGVSAPTDGKVVLGRVVSTDAGGLTSVLVRAPVFNYAAGSVSNGANVTGSIAANVFTLGWTGTLAPNIGGTGSGVAFELTK